jgi:hypothetical protein
LKENYVMEGKNNGRWWNTFRLFELETWVFTIIECITYPGLFDLKIMFGPIIQPVLSLNLMHVSCSQSAIAALTFVSVNQIKNCCTRERERERERERAGHRFVNAQKN